MKTFQDAIYKAHDAAAAVRAPSAHAKPWWTVDLTEAAVRLNQACRAQDIEEELSRERSIELRAQVKKCQNYMKRLTKAAKGIWSFHKWSKGARNYPTSAIYRGENRPPAVSHTEKCEAIWEELFQPPPMLHDEFIPNLIDDLPDDLPFQDVTRDEVREALFKSSAKTSPGESQTSYLVLRWTWSVAEDYMHALMKRCLQGGYHPKVWRRAIAVVLRKPKKPNYSKSRAYHLIQLLECLGKLLEKIVARRLTYLVGRHNLIPGTQFGGRSNSSAADAILSFTNDIQAAWNNGKVTSTLTFDIKRYFDFVNHARLPCELRRKGIPKPIVQWVATFLSECEAVVCIDGIRGEMKLVENGIPQGSPVSPILASFYSAELLEIFERAATPERNTLLLPNKPTPTTLFMYVDDGMLIVSSESLETNNHLLAAAYKKTDAWLRKAGLSPDLTKRELMHHSKRKNDGTPAIHLQEHDGSVSMVTVFSHVKWLGVYLDRKLTFNHHVKILAGRAENTVNGLLMLANTVCGLSQVHLRHLYRACVMPMMLFASATWWTGLKKHEKLVEKAQRKALRLICAAFHTSLIARYRLRHQFPPYASPWTWKQGERLSVSTS